MFFNIFASSSGPPLFWLDGSPLTFSKWQSIPQPDAACGFILRHSGFHWKATKDCNKNMHFICQFGMDYESHFEQSCILNHSLTSSSRCFSFSPSESGRRIACLGHNTTLQCGSGQVLMIEGAVFGRDNFHYCRPRFYTPTFTQDSCSQVDVAASIKGKT